MARNTSSSSSSSNSAAATPAFDQSKADMASSTTYRVTRNMVYPTIASSQSEHSFARGNQRPPRSRPEASAHGVEDRRRYSSYRSSDSTRPSPSVQCPPGYYSSSSASSSPSSSQSSSPISSLTSYNTTSATAPLSQLHVAHQVPSPPSDGANPENPSSPAIFPLFRHTTYISRRNVLDSFVNTSSQANSVQYTAPSYGLPNGSPPGSAAPASSYQNALSPLQTSDYRLRTPQEQLLVNHDLPRSLPPLPTLQTSSNHNFSDLQHTYFNMLAQDPSYGSAMNQQSSDDFSSAPAGAAANATLEGLIESAVAAAHMQSSSSSSPAVDERSATSEPLTFDHLFNSQQSTGTAPPTPYVHDASAFTTMQQSSSNNFLPPTFNNNTNSSEDDDNMLNAFVANFDFGSVDPSILAAAQSTPPSASEPPALSFSPTSPFSATPGTGLTLMDVDFDTDFEGMPLFGFDDGLTRPLFFNDDSGAVAPSALGLKGVAAPSAPSALAESAPAVNELDGLIAMTGTPSVVPVPLSSTFNSDVTLPSAANPRSAVRPTGHRKNLSPSALLPVDAPTQARTYRGPSATSRKDIPAFALGTSSSSRGASSSTNPSKSVTNSKKRKAEEDPEDADGDDVVDEEEMRSGKIKPRMGESEIEAKRRQNTLAARRSRHRKLAYVRELEEKVVDLMRQNEVLVDRLRGAGLEP